MWWATARPVDAALLDAAAQRRLARMRHPADRARHATAVRLGDLLVRAHAGPGARVVRPRGMAPRVGGGDPPLHISAAHAGSHVAVALGPSPVGVDVEPLDADAGAVESALSPAETRSLAALGGAQRRVAGLRIWVRKEAVLKATGRGMTLDPGTVHVSDAAAVDWVPAEVAGGDPSAPVVVRDLRGPAGAVAALALAGAPVGVDEHDGDAVLAGGGSR